MAKLLQQRQKIRGVRLAGKLPIEVDAVEEARSLDAGSEIALDEGIDAGGYEGLAILRLSVYGEVGGAAFKGDEDTQMRVFVLEQLKLMQMTAERVDGESATPLTLC